MSLSVRPYSRHLGDCIKSMAQLQAKLMWNRGLWELCAVVGGGGGGSVEEWSCFILSSLIFLSLLNSFCLFSTFCLFYLSRQAELEGVGRPVGMRMREQCKKGGDRWNEIKTSSMVSGNERKEDVEEERKQRVEQCYVKSVEFFLVNHLCLCTYEGLCDVGVASSLAYWTLWTMIYSGTSVNKV